MCPASGKFRILESHPLWMSHIPQLPLKTLATLPIHCLPQTGKLRLMETWPSLATRSPFKLTMLQIKWIPYSSSSKAYYFHSQSHSGCTTSLRTEGEMIVASDKMPQTCAVLTQSLVVVMNKCFSVCYRSLVKFQSAEMIGFDCFVQLYSCFWERRFFECFFFLLLLTYFILSQWKSEVS